MIVDSILIGIALVAGITGTLWEHPPKRGKIALIVLLLASSIAAIVKAASDDKDKELLQNLAIAGLALPNSAYDTVYRQMDKAYSDAPTVNCHHTSQGMTCPLQPAEGKPASTFVFNRYEVARVYADAVRGRDTEGFLKEIAEKRYDPKHLGDEYEDKLGILGFHTFYDMCRKFPADFNYDDKFGVKLLYDDGGAEMQIVLTPDEMTAPEANFGPILFGHFDKLFRTKIHQALPNCQ